MKQRDPGTLGRWGLIAGLVVSVSMFATVTAWATGLVPAPLGGHQTPAQKQTKIHDVEAAETATAQAPHVPQPPAAPQTPITSCPQASATSGLSPSLSTGGFHEHIISNAIVAHNQGVPVVYIVYAGARVANLQQGVLIVVRSDHDPCAAGAQGTKITFYDTPLQHGAVTVTQVSGVTLTFTTADGGSGHFDVVTGQFSA